MFLYLYDAANRLLQVGNVTFAYDNNGNTISKTDASGITNYQYDYENRLIGITYPNGLTNSFAYSPDGRRIKKVDSSGTTYYLLDRENVLQELNNEGATKVQYVTTLTIDDLISRIAEGSIVYYHKDGLGSVTALTDADQNLVATYKYDAFGRVVVQMGTAVNLYKFTSREFEMDANLYFYRARYYEPVVGRFLSADPLINNPQRAGTSVDCRLSPVVAPRATLGRLLHPYTYVSNNPVNLVDPTGLIYCVLVDVSVGGAYYFGVAGGCVQYWCKTTCEWKSIIVCYLCLCRGMGAGVSVSFGGCVAKTIESLPGFSLLVEGGIGYFSGQFTTNFTSSKCLAGGGGLGSGGWVCVCYGWSL